MPLSKKLKSWLQRRSRARAHKRSCGSRRIANGIPAIFETLEPRLLLAADVTLSGNRLVVTDTTNTATSHDNFSIEISGSNYVISNNSALTPSGLTDLDLDPNKVTVAVGSITGVDVNALGGNDTITLKNLSGKTTTLNGGSGADTYKFGDNWGEATIVDTGGGSLDFLPQFTETLEVHTPSKTAGAHEVIGTIGAVTSALDYPAGGTFTTDIPGPASVTNLHAGLGALADLGDRLEGVGKLGQDLFILNRQSIGDVFDIGGTLRQKLLEDVSLSGSPTLVQVVAAFNQVSGVAATGTRDSLGNVTIDFQLEVQATVTDIELSLGEEIEERVQVDALRGDLDMGLQWAFRTTVSPAGVFTATALGNMQVTADLDKSGFEGRAGFLGLNFASPSTVFLDAEITVDSFGVGKTTGQLAALNAAGLTQTGTALAKIDLIGGTTVDGVTVSGISSPPSVQLLGTQDNSTFDAFLGTPSPEFLGDFETFKLVNAGDVHAGLTRFAEFLDIFSDKALGIGIPLSATGQTLGDVLDLRDEFQANFLDSISRQPLTSGTLLSTLNNDRGVGTIGGDDLLVRLSNGTSFGVDLSAATAVGTVGAVILSIQSAAILSSVSMKHFEVRIDSRTGGLALVDRTGGIGEPQVTALNDSPAAGDLDLLSDPFRRFDQRTLLRDLNNGSGIGTAAGDDLQITLSTGAGQTIFRVDLDPISPTTTLDDLLDRIRNAAPSSLTAQEFQVQLDTDNHRLQIIDKTSGAAVNAIVTAPNGSTALSDLKINAASGGIGVPRLIVQQIGFPGPDFTTIQEMVSQANAGQAGIIPTTVQFSAGGTPTLSFTATVPLGGALDAITDDVALFDVGALSELVTTAGQVTLTPSGTLTLPFEILLTEIGSAVDLGSGTTSDFPVGGLNQGLGVQTIAGENDLEVKLSNGTSFEVDLDHDPVGITLGSLGVTGSGDAAADVNVSLADGSSFDLDIDPMVNSAATLGIS